LPGIVFAIGCPVGALLGGLIGYCCYEKDKFKKMCIGIFIGGLLIPIVIMLCLYMFKGSTTQANSAT